MWWYKIETVLFLSWDFLRQTGVGVTKPIFLRSVIFPIFQNYQNTCYIYDITFICDRCRRSRAAETPGKYGRDLKYLAYTFTKSIFPVTEKLTNGALVTPTPGEVLYCLWIWRVISFRNLYKYGQRLFACDFSRGLTIVRMNSKASTSHLLDMMSQIYYTWRIFLCVFVNGGQSRDL